MITIKLTRAPWSLAIEDTKSSRGHTRKLSNSQMLLSFLLVALFVPENPSQEAQLKWLRAYIVKWSGDPNNALLRALETISKSTLDRYLNEINEATLELPDGSVISFGQYLLSNFRSASEKFVVPPEYKQSTNAEWIARALGVEYADRPVYQSNYVDTITTVEKKPWYERLLNWIFG